MISVNPYRTIKNLFRLLIIVNILGCAGSFDPETLDPRGAGFQANLPEPGTRFVVWGNHIEAVDQASAWLHKRGLVIMDRTRLQQGLDGQKARLTGSSKDWAHILEAGGQIGADLVLFVEVTNVHAGRKFELSQVRNAPDFQLNVEVRGVQAQTGEIVSKGKAWQFASDQQLEVLIRDLTDQALQWAWVPSELRNEAQGPPRKTVRIEMPENPPQPSAGAMSVSEERQGTIFAASAFVANAETQQALSSTPAGENTDMSQSVRINPLEEHNDSNKVDSDYIEDFEPIQSSDSDPQESELGLQIASGALSILYLPVKIVYAGIGGVVGGIAYLLSAGDGEVADSIWVASVEGDYYLTPAHLRGDEPVNFKGESEKKLAGKDNSISPDFVQSAAPQE